ncbi:MAG: hypothetical protein LBH46_01975 [Rickettsiales bacterium]|nr:hypothetical protein [Rickettsiales bacterium]
MFLNKEVLVNNDWENLQKDNVIVEEGDRKEAYRALSSLLHKCKRSQENLSSEKWQWKLMEGHIYALEIALPIITNSTEINFTRNELLKAMQELSLILDKTEKIRKKLKQGSPQWTLNTNRIYALRIALFLTAKTLKNFEKEA